MGLNSSTLRRATPVVRHRSHIFDGSNIQTGCLQSTNGRFTSGAGAFNPNLNFFKSVGLRFTSCTLSHLCSRISCAFSRSLKACSTCTVPTNGVALHVSNGDQRIIESSPNMDNAMSYILGLLSLNDLFAKIVGQKLGCCGCGRLRSLFA